jgi:hypothetical protein
MDGPDGAGGTSASGVRPLDAWYAFCAQLRETGAREIEQSGATDPLDQVDGLRRLLSLTVDGLQWYLNCSNPDFPRFGQVRDTPEIADYWYAPVRGDAAYVLRGDLSTVFDVNVSVLPGEPWGQWTHPTTLPGASAVVGDLGRHELDVAEDGTFELTLSATRPQGCANWLALPPEGGLVTIREYLYDWAEDRPGSYEISRLGSEGEAPPRDTPEVFAGRLAGAGAFIRHYHNGVVSRRVRSAANTFDAPQHASGGNSHIWYAWGSFELEADQALVVECDPPDARAWCIQWLTNPWYANPDLVNRSTSLMGCDAAVDDDGRVRIVVAAADPGAPNWLDVSGYSRGVLVMRWIWSDEPRCPKTQVVPLAEVAERRDPGRALGDAGRARRLGVRRRHFARRRR